MGYPALPCCPPFLVAAQGQVEILPAHIYYDDTSNILLFRIFPTGRWHGSPKPTEQWVGF